MPISLDQLKQAQRPLKDRIADFLGRNHSLAYSVVEVITGLGSDPQLGTLVLLMMTSEQRKQYIAEHEAALNALVAERRVFAGKVGALTYYGVEPSK